MSLKNKTKKSKTSNRDPAIAELRKIPNVGPSIAGDLLRLGITCLDDLTDRDPKELYDTLCRIDRVRHDPCLLDVFMAVVDFANGEEPKPWWKYTEKRKSMNSKGV